MKRALIEIETRRWGEVVPFSTAKKSQHVGRGEFDRMPEIKANAPHIEGPGKTIEGVSQNEPSDLTSSKDFHPKMSDRKLQATLGRHLRGMFDDVARSPVPDKILELLKNLDTKEKEQS